MAADFAENHNVAADHRDRLIAMVGTWYVEAGKYNVMPVDGSGLARMVAEKPLVAVPRDRYTYRPGTQSIPFFAAPRVLNRPHSITADVEIPEGGAEGVLLCQGTSAGGYSLFVKDGKLRYVHNYVGRAVYGVESDQTAHAHGPPVVAQTAPGIRVAARGGGASKAAITGSLSHSSARAEARRVRGGEAGRL